MGKNKIINRDASPTSGGFRYQKLRLAIALLDEIEKDPNSKIIGAAEYKDDVYILKDDGTEVLEQDKNYMSSNFSFVSSAVSNSIINFLDQYIEADKDEKLKFIFYTNTSVSKEKLTKELGNEGLKLPSKSIIKLFQAKEYPDDAIEFCKHIIIKKYKNDYIANNLEGNLEEINLLSKEEWIKFFKKIEFIFDAEDGEGLEETLLEKIKMCNEFYNSSNIGKEKIIKSCILELIDESMSKKKFLQKIISSNDLKLIFLDSASIKNRMLDPERDVWDIVEDEKMKDTRNLNDKIKSVCDNFSEKGLSRFGREVIGAESTLKVLDSQIQKSIRIRVFQFMEEFFDNKKMKSKYTEEELKEMIKEIKDYTKKKFADLKKDYTYHLENENIIEKCVVLLISECYYSFD